jgi:hypothetical protein
MLKRFVKFVKNYILSNKYFLKLYWTYFHVDNLNTFVFQNDKLKIAYEVILSNNFILENYNIIDYGCANGALLFKLNSRFLNFNLKLTGIDYNIRALENAIANSKKHEINNIKFYKQCNNFECDLILSIATIIYLDYATLKKFNNAKNIFIITPYSRTNTYVSNKNIFRSKADIISLFEGYRLTEFPVSTNWDNDLNLTFVGIFKKIILTPLIITNY